MSWVISLIRVNELLKTKDARVCIAVDSPQYAEMLWTALTQAGKDGRGTWGLGTFYSAKKEVSMPEGASLSIKVLESVDDADMMSGLWYSNVLVSQRLDVAIRYRLHKLVRMPTPYTGSLTCEIFEEWRENPFDSKEADDKTVL